LTGEPTNHMMGVPSMATPIRVTRVATDTKKKLVSRINVIRFVAFPCLETLHCNDNIDTHLMHHVYHSEKFIEERDDRSSGEEIFFPIPRGPWRALVNSI
jgi:hypothetical protein